MPLVEADGYTLEVTSGQVNDGVFMAVVQTADGLNVARWIDYRAGLAAWKIRWMPDDLVGQPPAPAEPCLYNDGFSSPIFLGWELVKIPEAGLSGDVYVCVDIMQRDDYKASKSPEKAMSHGDRYLVNPAWGGTRPSRGFRIYRRKRPTGPVRILPSSMFCKPLPLP